MLLLNHLRVDAQPFTKKYIMSFLSCSIPNCGGPQNHTIHLAESNDGENWTLVPGFVPYQGSVPDVITRGNYLYIYSPGQVKRYNDQNNQWDANPVPVSIVDGIGNPVNFVDPSACVDDSGRLVLFFLNSTGIIGDPALCPTPPCTAYFDSAVEIAGSNGTQFLLQGGHRITYTTNTNFKPTDPDIFYKAPTWYQYISYGSGTMVYTATQLHGAYTQVATLPNGYLTNNNAGVPCGLFHPSENLFYSYGHRHAGNGMEITLAKHSNHNTQATYNTIITGSGIGLGNVQVASPGICENTFLATPIGETAQQPGFSVYPNPTTDRIFISCGEEIIKIYVFNELGQLILTKNLTSPQKIFETGNFPKGLYFVQAFTRNKSYSSGPVWVR